jgi:hypothetical protein
MRAMLSAPERPAFPIANNPEIHGVGIRWRHEP